MSSGREQLILIVDDRPLREEQLQEARKRIESETAERERHRAAIQEESG